VEKGKIAKKRRGRALERSRLMWSDEKKGKGTRTRDKGQLDFPGPTGK
jgi:hypothetical protein